MFAMDAYIDIQHIRTLIQLALTEDIGRGDLTAQAVPENTEAVANIVAKSACVLSGLKLIPLILEEAQVDAKYYSEYADGLEVKQNTIICTFSGNARKLLSVERVILNFLQRFCGIATQAALYKKTLGKEFSHVKILDTRKTTPGFRVLEKQAVKDGGLYNHRGSLDTGILIKENHIRAAGGITKTVEALAGKVPQGFLLEVEVTNLAEAQEAIHAGAEALLLDNFSSDELKNVVAKIRENSSNLFLEASGGITLDNLCAYASTGVDAISIGALTHSVKAADLSMLFTFEGQEE